MLLLEKSSFLLSTLEVFDFQASYSYCHLLVALAQTFFPGLMVPALTLEKV